MTRALRSNPKASNYDVLVTWPFAVEESLPDTEALIAGTENGMNLWICIADFAGGKYPGKIRSGFDGCHIGLGNVEIDVNQTKGTWQLLIPIWEPFAPGDPDQNPSLFKAGMTPTELPFTFVVRGFRSMPMAAASIREDIGLVPARVTSHGPEKNMYSRSILGSWLRWCLSAYTNAGCDRRRS